MTHSTSLGEAAAIGRIEKALFGGDDRLVTLGRYVIGEQIGAGAFAKVYRARDPELDRDVALKVLTATSGELDRAELLREARVLATIGHPNVVAVHDAGIVEDAGGLRVFIAMELVAGTNLRTWLAHAPRAQIRGVLVQAGRGLAAAHAAGLVHRDLKPDNVLVGDDGRVRVVDFGLARPGAADGDEPDPIAGTPAYMAPEQLAGAPATAASDQFAFAVTCWEALHGERPFTGKSVGELRAAFGLGPDAALASTVAASDTPAGSSPDPAAHRDDPAPAHGDAGGPVHRDAPAHRDDPAPSHRDAPAHRDDPAPAHRVPTRVGPPRTLVTRGRIDRVLARALSLDPAARFPSIDALLAALDRRRPRWVVPAAVAAVAVAVTLIVARAARSDDDPCPVPLGELAGVWDAPQRTAIARAFAATGVPYARGTFDRIATVLDRETAGWLAGRRDACAATAIRHEQSPDLLDRRVACLTEWRRELRALTDAFATASRATVQSAVLGVHDLPDVAGCVEALPPLPPTADRTHVDELFDRLATARTLHVAGKITEALAIADAVAADRVAVRYAPLGVAAALWQSETELAQNQHDAARAAARRAFDLAIAIPDKRAAAQAAATIAFAGAFDASRAVDALQWVETGRSQLAGIDGALELDAKLANAEGNIYLTRGDPASAEAPMLRAIHDFEQIDPDHPNLGSSLAMLGISELDRGNLAAASRHLHEALARVERNLGSEHPEVATTLVNVALAESAEGHLRAAATSVDRAITLMQRLYGADYVLLAYAELARAVIAQAMGEPAETHFAAATRIAEAAYGTHPVTAQTLLGHADYLTRTGHARDAIPLATRGRDILLAAMGPTDIGVAVAEATLARAEANLARAKSAAAQCAAAPAGVPGAACAIVYQTYGDLLLAAGDRPAAATQLRAAIDALAKGTPDPVRLAELRLALAKATGDVALAKTALAELPADADPKLRTTP